MWNEIIWPVVVLGGLGLLLGLGLAIAAKVLAVKVDENLEKVRELLPGANCGGCGYAGCDGMAKALCAGEAKVNQCSPLSCENLNAIAELLGVEATPADKIVARVLCKGDSENCVSQYTYSGISDCRAAALVAGGPKSCAFGCVGLLTCGKVCPFGAIYLSDKGIAAIDETKCTGCGQCVAACPKHVIKVMPQNNNVFISCRTTEKGKAVTVNCKAGCIACGICSKKCPEGAIEIVNNLPVIDYSKCTGCGICAEVCPKGSITNMDKLSNVCEAVNK